MGISDYVSNMSFVRELDHKPSSLYMAIKLLDNDLPVKRISDITGLDFDFVEKLDLLYTCDTQSAHNKNTELKYEIAECLLELSFLTDEIIADKSKLMIDEIERLRASVKAV